MASRLGDRRRRKSRWWSPIGRTVVAAISAWATLAATADASLLTKTAGAIVYTASDGEPNRLTVSRQGTNYVFAESGGVDIDGRCETISSAPSVTCGAAGVTEIDIYLQDNGDSLTIQNSVAAAGQPRILAEGGDGTDMLNGGDGPESLCGGPGDDTLDGGGGNDRLDFPCVDPQTDQTPGPDTLIGGAGDDQLNGGPGSPLESDKLFGGVGTDSADYSQRAAALTITLDDAGDDGQAGEGDNVHADVENVIGGSGGDTVVGSGAPNVLDARDGNDVVLGGGADDVLAGGAGNDTLMGEAGGDTLTAADGDDGLAGGDGNDYLGGGGGADVLDGGASDDMLEGGAGIDTLDGADGNDRLNGGEAALVGGDGGDQLRGGAGADSLLGGPGDDSLDGGLGPDQINGEAGRDTLSYEHRATSVTVTLNGRADDGEDGERDNVAGDVEVVLGGTLWDTLEGDRSANTFQAGAGEDLLVGNAGRDTLDGGGGSDLIWARDRTHDTVDCGGGADIAIVDKDDDVRDCKWLDRVGRRKPALARSALVTGRDYRYGAPGQRRNYPLEGSLKFPMGSRIDARQAQVRVTTATASKGARQEMSVRGGPFTVRQTRSTAVFRLTAGPRRCSRGVNGPRAPADARAPRIVMRIEKPKRRRGRPRTPQQVEVPGDNSIGAAFGTEWTTEERCNGTFTRVRSGVVKVRDLRRHVTKVLRAGQSYLAPRR
jgi:Ca2+-binding RTX toxin-like protein